MPGMPVQKRWPRQGRADKSITQREMPLSRRCIFLNGIHSISYVADRRARRHLAINVENYIPRAIFVRKAYSRAEKSSAMTANGIPSSGDCIERCSRGNRLLAHRQYRRRRILPKKTSRHEPSSRHRMLLHTILPGLQSVASNTARRIVLIKIDVSAG